MSSGTGRPATHFTYSRAHVNEKRWDETLQREKLFQTLNKRKTVMTCDKEGREGRKDKGPRGPRRDIQHVHENIKTQANKSYSGFIYWIQSFFIRSVNWFSLGDSIGEILFDEWISEKENVINRWCLHNFVGWLSFYTQCTMQCASLCSAHPTIALKGGHWQFAQEWHSRQGETRSVLVRWRDSCADKQSISQAPSWKRRRSL